MTVKKKSRKVTAGQPTKYKSEYGRIAKKACQLGATMDDLAEMFDVTKQTIFNWRDSHPQEFFDAIKSGKVEADDDVERSLYKRAIGGHKITEKKITVNPDGSKAQAVTEKEVSADTVACIFWLKNRRPELWREKHEVTASIDGFSEFLIDALKKDG